MGQVRTKGEYAEAMRLQRANFQEALIFSTMLLTHRGIEDLVLVEARTPAGPAFGIELKAEAVQRRLKATRFGKLKEEVRFLRQFVIVTLLLGWGGTKRLFKQVKERKAKLKEKEKGPNLAWDGREVIIHKN